MKSRIKLVVDIILAIAVVVFLVTLGRRVIQDRSFSEASVIEVAGKSMVSGIDFNGSKQTVLLVLDKECKFCKSESPFYRHLADDAHTRGTRFIIAFEHDLDQARKYLTKEGLPANDLLRVHLKALAVDGTPTLMLLNSKGEKIGSWSGSLSEPVHHYLLSILGKDETEIRNDNSPYLALGNLVVPPSVSADELKTQLAAGKAIVLDVDDRRASAGEHIDGAVSIPEDEVYSRALNELPESKAIAIFSRTPQPRLISNVKVSLEKAGFKSVIWVRQSLGQCRDAGISIVGH